MVIDKGQVGACAPAAVPRAAWRWPLAIRVVALVFLAGVAGKLVAPAPYWSIVRGVSASFPGTLAGALLVAVEAATGAGLLLNPCSKPWRRLAIALLVVFLAVVPLAQLGGVMTTDCGCFGGLIQTSPLSAVIRNAALLGVLVWAPDTPPSQNRVRFLFLAGPVVLAAAAGALAMRTGIQPHRLARELGPGLKVVAIVNHSCRSCREVVAGLSPEVNTVHGRAKVVLWTIDDESQWIDAPAGILKRSIGEVALTVAQATPAVVLVRDGQIVTRVDPAALQSLLPEQRLPQFQRLEKQ